MKTSIVKTAQIVGTIALFISIAPLLPIIGLMHVVAISSNENVAPTTRSIFFPQQPIANSASPALVMSH